MIVMFFKPGAQRRRMEGAHHRYCAIATDLPQSGTHPRLAHQITSGHWPPLTPRPADRQSGTAQRLGILAQRGVFNQSIPDTHLIIQPEAQRHRIGHRPLINARGSGGGIGPSPIAGQVERMNRNALRHRPTQRRQFRREIGEGQERQR